MSRAIERIVQDSGPIDVLVNNAGIERMGAIEDVSMDDLRAVMETNYFGAVRCIKAVLPSMRERRSGCFKVRFGLPRRFFSGGRWRDAEGAVAAPSAIRYAGGGLAGGD